MAAGTKVLSLHPAADLTRLRIRIFHAAVEFVPLYDLSIDGQNNYFAEGVLVHNKPMCWCGGGAPSGCPSCDPPVPECEALRRGPVSPVESARRLMTTLWGEVDDALLGRVGGDVRLAVLADRVAFVRTLLADPRARQGARRLAVRWLGLDVPRPLQVSDALWEAMREETQRFVAEALLAPRPGFQTVEELLSADYTFVNEALARHYGLGVAGAGFRRVSLDSELRGGLLTQGAVLSAHPSASARGSFVVGRLTGCIGEIPWVVHVSDHPPSSDRTIPRADLQRALSAQSCVGGCHRLLDGLGFPLQAFDELGRHRTHEPDGSAIDVAGWYEDPLARLRGYRELAQHLQRDPRFGTCLAEELLDYAATAAQVVLPRSLAANCTANWRATGRYEYLVGDLFELLNVVAAAPPPDAARP